MIDTGKLWDEAQREARAEVIATHRVVTSRHDVTPTQRAIIAMQSLALAIRELESLCATGAITRQMEEQIDEADTRLTLLRHRVRMKRSTVHLCSEMGRPAP